MALLQCHVESNHVTASNQPDKDTSLDFADSRRGVATLNYKVAQQASPARKMIAWLTPISGHLLVLASCALFGTGGPTEYCGVVYSISPGWAVLTGPIFVVPIALTVLTIMFENMTTEGFLFGSILFASSVAMAFWTIVIGYRLVLGQLRGKRAVLWRLALVFICGGVLNLLALLYVGLMTV